MLFYSTIARLSVIVSLLNYVEVTFRQAQCDEDSFISAFSVIE